MFKIPKELENEYQYRLDDIHRDTQKNGVVFFNDTIFRLDHFVCNTENILLEFSKTTYFHFAAFNTRLRDKIETLDKNIPLIDYLKEKPNDLMNSNLPNPLAVCLTIILDNESKLVLARRSNRNFEANSQISTPIGGTMSFDSGDFDKKGIPDPFATAKREAREELNLTISDDKIRLLGLGRNLTNFKPEIFGETRLPQTEDELKRLWCSSNDKLEASELMFLDLNDEGILEFIKTKNFSHVGKIATIASILSNQD
jgi:8-oxo-dGTP pyrophosphatase MutT (NUDIX family)